MTGLICLVAFGGCGRTSDESALRSDVNGYQCQNCQSKFYADTKTYVVHCPDCRQKKVQQVVGYQCSSDNRVTISIAGRNAPKCGQCGVTVGAMVMPSAEQLKEWGGTYKVPADVGS